MNSAVVEMMLRNSNKNNTTKKHEAFAMEYMVDYDVVRSYKAAYNDDDMEDNVARAAGSRLLRSVIVQKIIDQEECKYIAQKRQEKEDVVLQAQRMYYTAMRDRDYASAKGALDMLFKHYGLYNKHNKQKKYSPDDLATIRQKLEAQGVMFGEVNKPAVLESSPLVVQEKVE